MTITAHSNPSAQDFARDCPELYHYTSLTGLKGIVETGALWATHFSGLNDSTELNTFREAFHDPLSQWLAENLPRARLPKPISYPLKNGDGSPSSDVRAISRQLIDLVYRRAVVHPPENVVKHYPHFSNPFISCFCSHHQDSGYEQQNGLLSQWRGYAANGGCCIVFDTKRMLNLIHAECDQSYILNAFFSAVTYSDDDEAIEGWCKELTPVFGEPLGLTNPYSGDFLSSPVVKFTAAISLFKHRAFREEREIRISATPVTEEDMRSFPQELGVVELPLKNIYTREIRGRRIKYIALFEDLKLPLPINRVIVGPSIDQEKNRRAIRDAVGPHIDIVLSKTPYVP